MKEKLVRGVLWLSGAKVLVNLLGLGSTLVLARLLTPEDFGLVAIAFTLITIISSMTEMSLSSALVHHHEPTEAHFNSAWTMNAVRAMGLASVLWASSYWVADFYRDSRLQPVLATLALSVLASGLSNPKQVVLTRRLEFWQEFAVAVSQKLAGFVVGLAAAWVYRSYWALVAGTLATQLAGLVVSYWIMPYRPRPSLVKVRELWSFSAWITLSYILNTLNWKLDHLLIGTFISPRALGTYTVGDNLAGMATRETIGPIEQTLFPGLRQVVHEPVRLKQAYARAQGFICMVALPIGFGVGALAQPLVGVLLGPQWDGAVLIVHVLACVFALQTVTSAVHPLAMAKGETRKMFGRDLLGFCVRVPIILIGMWWAGLTGIVFGRLISGTLIIGVNALLVRDMTGLSLSEQLRNCWRSLASVVVMWVALVGLQIAWPVATAGAARLEGVVGLALSGGGLYLLLHWGLWRLQGRPDGAERELVAHLGKVLAKTRRASCK